MTSPPPDRCPLCGADNRCGMAAGTKTCWCTDVTIDPATLSRVPAAALWRACLCRACATAATTPPQRPAVDDHVPSPCTGLCELDRATRTCRGCHRTAAEIAAWARLDGSARRAILARLAARLR